MKYFIMFSLVLSIALLSGMNQASAQTRIYMKIEGTKQGTIAADPKEKRTDGRGTEWLSLTEVVKLTPDQTAPGAGSGKTKHNPIVITREVDAASPKIYQALTTNEALPNVIIEFTRTTAGKEVIYRTIKLKDAAIATVKKDPSKQKGTSTLEEVSFAFQAIQVENIAGSTSASDDWNANSQ